MKTQTASGVCLLLFLLLAAAVVQASGPLPIDLRLSAMAVGLRGPVLDQVMIDASYLCVWQVIVAGGIASSVWLLVWKRWFPAAVIWLSLAGDELVVSGIKSVVERPRPNQATALLPAAGYSFPSGHTFASLAFYGVFGLVLVLSVRSALARSALVFGVGLLSGVVGFSRVYVGAHWSTDVVGSWLLEFVWLSLMGALLMRRVGSRRQSSRPTAMLLSGGLAFCAWVVAIAALAAFDPAVRMSGSIAEAPAPMLEHLRVEE